MEYPRALVEYRTSPPEIDTSAVATSATRESYSPRAIAYVAGRSSTPATNAGRRMTAGVVPKTVVAAFTSSVCRM